MARRRVEPDASLLTPDGTPRPSGPAGAGQPTDEVCREVATVTRWLVAAAVVMVISRVHVEVSLLAAVQAPLLVTAGAAFLMFSDTARWRPRDLGRHWIPQCIGILLVVAVVGLPFSIYQGRTFRFLWDSFSRTLLLATLVWGVARTTVGSRFVAKTIVVGGAAASCLALLVGRVDRSGRLAGAHTYDPNDLAFIAVATIPLAAWWALMRGSRDRWIGVAALLVSLYTLVQTDSRGGFIGIAAVVTGALVLGIFSGAGPFRKISLGLVVLAVLSFPLLPHRYRETVRSLGDLESDYNMTSETGRWQLWGRGLRYAWDRPLLGVGMDNFRTAEGRISELARSRAPGVGLKWSTAHNSFIQVAAELGIVAAAVFLMLALRTPVALIAHYRRQRRSRAPPDLLPALLALSLIGFSATGFFLSLAYKDLPYLLFGVGAAILMRAPRRSSAPLRRVTPLSHAPMRPPAPAAYPSGRGAPDGIGWPLADRALHHGETFPSTERGPNELE